MARSVGLVIALALAGCGMAGEQHQMVAAETDLAEPGEFREKWETRIEVPGMAPRVEEERRDKHCLKGGDNPVRKKVTERFAELCEGLPLRFADGQIRGDLNCRYSSSAVERTPVRVSGSYGRDHVEMIVDTHYQRASLRQIRKYERIGDCETAAEEIARGDWSVTENREAAAH